MSASQRATGRGTRVVSICTGAFALGLGRHFQAQIGTSPWKWPARQRITGARQLLETCDLPVDQIARLCGFESTVAFRRRFRDLVHLSPSDYRRAYRGPVS